MKYTKLLIILCSINLNAQVGISDNSDFISTPIQTNAIIEFRTDSKVILLPRLSQAVINGISPVSGMMVYNTTTNVTQIAVGTPSAWRDIITSLPNQVPSFSTIGSSGTYQVGQTLTAAQNGYSDAENDTQATPIYTWKKSDNASGTANVTTIGTASTYLLTPAEANKYIQFCVNATAITGATPGNIQCGTWNGSVANANVAPTANSVVVSGTKNVGQTLNGTYSYSDADSDLEASSTKKWQRADDSSGTNNVNIASATNANYLLVTNDANKYLRYCVTPIAATGVTTGTEVCSNYYGTISSLVTGTIGRINFESTPATPTISYTTTGGGAIQSGGTTASDAPANTNKYYEGVQSFGILNGTSTLESSTINTAGFTNNITLSFRLAAFSIAATNNGLDQTDTVSVMISTDGGASYSNEMIVTGFNNYTHNFNGTGTRQKTYSGVNSPSTFNPTAGGNATGASAYSNIVLTNIPNSAQLRFKITLLNNASTELWAIDDVQLFSN